MHGMFVGLHSIQQTERHNGCPTMKMKPFDAIHYLNIHVKIKSVLIDKGHDTGVIMFLSREFEL